MIQRDRGVVPAQLNTSPTCYKKMLTSTFSLALLQLSFFSSVMLTKAELVSKFAVEEKEEEAETGGIKCGPDCYANSLRGSKKKPGAAGEEELAEEPEEEAEPAAEGPAEGMERLDIKIQKKKITKEESELFLKLDIDHNMVLDGKEGGECPVKKADELANPDPKKRDGKLSVDELHSVCDTICKPGSEAAASLDEATVTAVCNCCPAKSVTKTKSKKKEKQKEKKVTVTSNAAGGDEAAGEGSSFFQDADGAMERSSSGSAPVQQTLSRTENAPPTASHAV
ncbi:unnamed protein product [Amoebophrya sp. A120]|nr:unnamed protein product [Amoebophrya sp. A120]|eukprot:GSA120T00004587001.1